MQPASSFTFSPVRYTPLRVRRSSIRVRHGSIRVWHGSIRVRHGSVRVQHGSIRVWRGSIRVRHGSVRVQFGTIRVWRGSIRVRLGSIREQRGSFSVQRGLNGSLSACCAEGPSLIPGSAPHGGFSCWAEKQWRYKKTGKWCRMKECMIVLYEWMLKIIKVFKKWHNATKALNILHL